MDLWYLTAKLPEHLTKATGISASEKEDAHQNQHI